MIKKEIVAAIVAVVVVVAAAAVLMTTNNEKDVEEPLAIDTLRTDLKVGDKYENIVKSTISMPLKTTDNSTYVQFFSFLGDEFTINVVGEDKVTYKGVEYECFVVGYSIP